MDAIFLLGLLGTTAEVESTCPVTNQAIRLTVTPDGVASYSPSNTVLSITVPGLSCRTTNDSPEKAQTGPTSDGCSQMFFFSSSEVAEKWIEDHPNIAIFTVEEAYRLAQENWIDRRDRIKALAVSPSSMDKNGSC